MMITGRHNNKGKTQQKNKQRNRTYLQVATLRSFVFFSFLFRVCVPHTNHSDLGWVACAYAQPCLKFFNSFHTPPSTSSHLSFLSNPPDRATQATTSRATAVSLHA